ncbi:hypothetical protein BDU57DRAFT_550708 [Ampelomyces quisqualis]|uniref:Uncharacterized protein n=1 Tax=Ampelomyces quisqualis TaxID=50730 RepID=A0A6A5QBL1_AMPQU|nr:hypothetical protein BDU57DRAFT_550708 [Ampelomyces quisqualis]
MDRAQLMTKLTRFTKDFVDHNSQRPYATELDFHNKAMTYFHTSFKDDYQMPYMTEQSIPTIRLWFVSMAVRALIRSGIVEVLTTPYGSPDSTFKFAHMPTATEIYQNGDKLEPNNLLRDVSPPDKVQLEVSPLGVDTCPAYTRSQRILCGRDAKAPYFHCDRHVMSATQKLRLSPTQQKWFDQLRLLQSWATSDTHHIRTVNVDFTNFVNCTINYESKTFDNLIDLVCRYQGDQNYFMPDAAQNSASSTFSRIYGNSQAKTTSFSFSIIKEALIDHRFDCKTHVILGYGSSSPESRVMRKVFLGDDRFITQVASGESLVDQGFTGIKLNPIDIQQKESYQQATYW